MAEETKAPEEQASEKRPVPRMFIVVPLVVLLAALLYGFGLRQGRGQLDAVRTQYEEQLATAASAHAAAAQQIAVLRNAKNLREAEGTILWSAVDLDQRNFGTATDRVRKASAVLERVQTPAGGVDVAAITALRGDLDRLDFNVAVNLGSQRTAVLKLAEGLHALTPEVRPAPIAGGAPPADAPAAVPSKAK